MTLNDFLASYAAPVTQCAFMFAFGACVGSLTNVLVYRLPRGLDVVAPPSACPACGTRLTWRENIPVLGWLALRGRCRFCKSHISPEYPLVEAFVGLMFVALYLLWFLVRPGTEWLGIDWGLIRPEWTANGFAQTWPSFVVLLILASCLVAMTLVDFKTFTIPHELTTVPAIAGIVVHPIHALFVQLGTPGHLIKTAPSEVWTIATFGPDGWRWVGAGIGGMLGLGLSLLLLRMKILRRSFEDYDKWEQEHLGKAAARPNGAPDEHARPDSAAHAPTPPPSGEQAAPASPDAAPTGVGQPPTSAPNSAPDQADPDAPVGPRHKPSRRAIESVLVYAACIGALGLVGALAAPMARIAEFWGLLAGVLLGPIVAGLILSIVRPIQPEQLDPEAEGDQDSVAGDPEMWLAYPHARREMIKELSFVGPVVCLALAGAAVGGWLGGPWTFNPATGQNDPASGLPLWATVLGAVLLGYLIGGGVVWGVRIFGSLAFGKEAMGMGDVHMMAAVGACAGWIDATLAFFLAAFVGIYWVIAQAARTRGAVSRAMPYGPYLAAGTFLVLVGKPVVEWGLGRIVGASGPIPLP